MKFQVIKEAVEQEKETCPCCDKRKLPYDAIEWEANEGRKKRIARYRQLANLDENAEITEDNILEWAFNKTCVDNNCGPDRLKAELLGQKWSEYERD